MTKKDIIKLIAVAMLATIGFILVICEPCDECTFWKTLFWTRAIGFGLWGIVYLILKTDGELMKKLDDKI